MRIGFWRPSYYSYNKEPLKQYSVLNCVDSNGPEKRNPKLAAVKQEEKITPTVSDKAV